VPNYYFRGDIDEIRISDGALSPSDFIVKADPVPEIGNVAIETVDADNVALTWTSSSDYSYVLLETPSLTIPSWSTNTAGIPGGEGSVTVITVPATQAATFYSITSED